MAARFSVGDVIQDLSKDEPTTNCTGIAGRNEYFGEKDMKSRVAEWLATFECGKDFDKALFVNTAKGMLLPLVSVCEKKATEAPHLSPTLYSSTVNAAVIFRSESQIWLQRIHRRLAGKRSIRQPYYCEIRRDIPVEMYNILARSLNTSEFREPYCYVVGNKKGKVISFTFLPLLKQFLSLLSGKSVDEITQYFERKLNGRRKDHRTKVLVSVTKDFALRYSFAKGQLTVSFNYGEWNRCGFPQHNCELYSVADN
jgi:hypothetical protein